MTDKLKPIVKPLVWVEDQITNDEWWGNGLFSYHIKRTVDDHWKWSHRGSGTWCIGMDTDTSINLEATKAAAQADYEARILSCVDPTALRNGVLEEAAMVVEEEAKQYDFDWRTDELVTELAAALRAKKESGDE